MTHTMDTPAGFCRLVLAALLAGGLRGAAHHPHRDPLGGSLRGRFQFPGRDPWAWRVVGRAVAEFGSQLEDREDRLPGGER